MELKAISELNGYTFVVPYQQRGYKWTPDNIKVLLDDFKDFLNNKEKKMYCLQPIAVVPINEKEKRFEVIDGQQRLTTLYLLWMYLFDNKQIYQFDFQRDENNERRTFLKVISKIKKENDRKIDYFYISRAYLTIKEWFHDRDIFDLLKEESERCVLGESETIDKVKDQFRKLLSAQKDLKSIQVLWYTVDSGADHDSFRNINSGKIQLSNSDLIKALLLNNTNGFENRQQIAAQFESMERQLAENRFWYMLQKKDIEPLKGQSRIDLLFNIVADVNSEDYQIDSRKSFSKFSKYTVVELAKMWKNVREKYQRFRDLFDDPYTFHYVGFLTYCGKNLNDILCKYADSKKQYFKDYLKGSIKRRLIHESLDEYSFEDPKEALRKLFVLHNIETLLCRYEDLKEKKGLKFSYENFPFELLYSHTWNIEHIASNTDNNLKKESDRRDWIESIEADFTSMIRNKSLQKRLQTELGILKSKATDSNNPITTIKALNILEKILSDNNNDNEFEKLKSEAELDLGNKENFDKLYKYVVKVVDDNPISEEDKNGIGNLVLLDEHTNKSFHNSLFPRKRRIVIMASGLRNDKDTEKDVESLYIPICTQQVYTKSYNKQSTVNLNCWGREDYDAYYSDMQEKLKDYFTSKQGEQ